MIKLNNKNITYVAFADSDNSIKAPKKIWYADSPNSVKLVYRRKDALIEDEDYEVHQWLDFVYEGTQSIRFMALPINSDTVSFQRVYVEYTNNSIFLTGGSRYSYGLSSSNMLIRIWDYNEQTSVYAKAVDTETTLRSIQSTSTSLLINEVEIPKYGFPIDSVVWLCTQSHSCRNSSITVDGIERYIPVQLLKFIPSKYDANGIARQAGECGMYDTVNDVFYGNVASSGTFTVADDE